MIKIQCDVCGFEVKADDVDKDDGRPLYFDFYAVPVGGGPGLFSFDEDDPKQINLPTAGICFCNKCAMEIAQWGAAYYRDNEVSE